MSNSSSSLKDGINQGSLPAGMHASHSPERGTAGGADGGDCGKPSPGSSKWRKAVNKVVDIDRKTRASVVGTMGIRGTTSFLRNCITSVMQLKANGELDDLWDIEVRPDTEQWNWIIALLSKNRYQRVVSELRRLQEILRKYAFFANLPPATRQLVVQSLEMKACKSQQTIYSRGEKDENIYVVLGGSVRLHGRPPELSSSSGRSRASATGPHVLEDGAASDDVDGEVVGPGETFGDEVLSEVSESKDYTATALKRTLCVSISKQDHDFLHNRSIDTESDDKLGSLLLVPKKDRTESQLSEIEESVNQFPFFEKMKPDLRKELCHSIDFMELQAGHVIFNQGDEGDCFYIVLKGAVEIYIGEMPPIGTAASPAAAKGSAGNGSGQDMAGSSSTGSSNTGSSGKLVKPVVTLGPGAQFGELSLIENQPRAGAAVTGRRTELALLTKGAYQRTLKRQHMNHLKSRVDFLSNLNIFKHLRQSVLFKHSYFFTEKTFGRNDVISQQGDKATDVHFILSGECKLVKRIARRREQRTSKTTISGPSTASISALSNDSSCRRSAKRKPGMASGVSASVPNGSNDIEIALLSVGDAIGDYAAVVGCAQPYTAVASSINVKTLSIKTGNIGNVTDDTTLEILRSIAKDKHEWYESRVATILETQERLRERLHDGTKTKVGGRGGVNGAPGGNGSGGSIIRQAMLSNDRGPKPLHDGAVHNRLTWITTMHAKEHGAGGANAQKCVYGRAMNKKQVTTLATNSVFHGKQPFPLRSEMYSLKNQVQQQKQSSSVYVRSALNGAAKSQQTSTLSPLPAAASVSASPMRTRAAFS